MPSPKLDTNSSHPGPPVLQAALQHVFDMLVMPKLRRAVTEWEPRQETVPIHAWLHPWLPYLGGALEELYPGIRHKLSVALQVRPRPVFSSLVWHFHAQVAEETSLNPVMLMYGSSNLPSTWRHCRRPVPGCLKIVQACCCHVAINCEMSHVDMSHQHTSFLTLMPSTRSTGLAPQRQQCAHLAQALAQGV